jgi:hypothetical protein
MKQIEVEENNGSPVYDISCNKRSKKAKSFQDKTILIKYYFYIIFLFDTLFL